MPTQNDEARAVAKGKEEWKRWATQKDDRGNKQMARRNRAKNRIEKQGPRRKERKQSGKEAEKFC